MHSLPESTPITTGGDKLETSQRTDTVLLLVITGLIFISRLPFAARYLTKWDSCNYAFALENFDIANHSPHPPGYPFYILAGKILNAFTGDANLAYILVGIILCSLTACFLYLTGKLLFGRLEGFLAAALFVFSPAAWYLSSAVSSYMSEAAMVSILLYLVLAYHNDRNLKWLPVMVVLTMGIGAGFRIPGFVVCLPLFFLHLLGLDWRGRILSLLGSGLIILAAYGWVITATGGWAEYTSVVTTESVKHVNTFQMLLDNPVDEFSRNFGQILLFTRQTLGRLWPVLLLPFFFPMMVFTRMTRRKLFILVALLSPLLLYTFVFVNLTSIMLILLPLYCLIIVRGFSRFASLVSALMNSSRGTEYRGRHKRALLALLTIILIVTVGLKYIKPGDGNTDPLDEFSLQGIYSNDLYIESLIETTVEFDPEDTCLLLWMGAKHAGYYLRDYHVIWDKYVTRLPSKGVTEIFSLYRGAREMIPMRSVDSGDTILFTLDLPTGCRNLIFRGDNLPSHITLNRLHQPRELNNTLNLYIIENIPDRAAIQVNRLVGERARDIKPGITWSITVPEQP